MNAISCFSLSFLLLISCNSNAQKQNTQDSKLNLSEKEKSYWYSGKAEITSFELHQSRYGEDRLGKAVHIFVTEPFSKISQTKADNPTNKDETVLKLNFTKKFLTGIYPYSIMTSSFFPFGLGNYSHKISFSAQEWCGHTYMELINQNNFNLDIFSYFQGESRKSINLKKAILEDDIWSMIRVRNQDLPIGTFEMIPSFEFFRLLHKKTKTYQVKAEIRTLENGNKLYSIFYPKLKRTLDIEFENHFPYKINAWKEAVEENGTKNITIAKKIKTLNIDYWNRNTNLDLPLRNDLSLDN